MANTLLLDIVSWDLVVDLNGNIAMATEPYALAQDAASACRLFTNEMWYDLAQGVPYLDPEVILGELPPVALIKAYLIEAAMSVPDVTSANVFLASLDRNRNLSGQVIVTSAATGQVAVALFGQAAFA